MNSDYVWIRDRLYANLRHAKEIDSAAEDENPRDVTWIRARSESWAYLLESVQAMVDGLTDAINTPDESYHRDDEKEFARIHTQ